MRAPGAVGVLCGLSVVLVLRLSRQSTELDQMQRALGAMQLELEHVRAGRAGRAQTRTPNSNANSAGPDIGAGMHLSGADGRTSGTAAQVGAGYVHVPTEQAQGVNVLGPRAAAPPPAAVQGPAEPGARARPAPPSAPPALQGQQQQAPDASVSLPAYWEPFRMFDPWAGELSAEMTLNHESLFAGIVTSCRFYFELRASCANKATNVGHLRAPTCAHHHVQVVSMHGQPSPRELSCTLYPGPAPRSSTHR